MIEFLGLAGAAFLMAVFAVWLYRMVTRARALAARQAGPSSRSPQIRLAQQQGYVSLPSSGPYQDQSGVKRTTRSGGGVRTPWGW